MKKLAVLTSLFSVCAAASAADAGWVDGADANSASGWACTSEQPYYQGWVHIYRDDGPILGAIFAGNVREQAVGNLCGGHPYHGFSGALDYPSNLIDGKKHNVHFYFIRGDGSHFEIPGSPKQVQFGNPPPSEFSNYTTTTVTCSTQDPYYSTSGWLWQGSTITGCPNLRGYYPSKKYVNIGDPSIPIGAKLEICATSENLSKIAGTWQWESSRSGQACLLSYSWSQVGTYPPSFYNQVYTDIIKIRKIQ